MVFQIFLSPENMIPQIMGGMDRRLLLNVNMNTPLIILQEEGVIPYMGYIGMCKGYGFSAILVINWVSIFALQSSIRFFLEKVTFSSHLPSPICAFPSSTPLNAQNNSYVLRLEGPTQVTSDGAQNQGCMWDTQQIRGRMWDEIILLGQDVGFFMVEMQAVSNLMARQMVFYKNHLMTKKIPNKD